PKTGIALTQGRVTTPFANSNQGPRQPGPTPPKSPTSKDRGFHRLSVPSSEVEFLLSAGYPAPTTANSSSCGLQSGGHGRSWFTSSRLFLRTLPYGKTFLKPTMKSWPKCFVSSLREAKLPSANFAWVQTGATLPCV